MMNSMRCKGFFWGIDGMGIPQIISVVVISIGSLASVLGLAVSRNRVAVAWNIINLLAGLGWLGLLIWGGWFK